MRNGSDSQPEALIAESPVATIGAELEAAAVLHDAIGGISGAQGAYVLAIRLDLRLSVSIRNRALDFVPGWYAYAGSARGPGGLRARLARHFRRDKCVHWHVDRLTLAAAEIVAFARKDASECELAERLRASGAFRDSHDGFGSSDCRICRAHLLEWCDNV